MYANVPSNVHLIYFFDQMQKISNIASIYLFIW